MSQKIRKNYKLNVISNQPTVENIKTINDTISTESASRKNEILALNAQISNLSLQISTLSSQIQSLQANLSNLNFYKETFILTDIDILNGYIEISRIVKNNSMRIEMGCISLQENVDYTISINNNKTLILFINNELDPFFEKNDELYVQYYS